MSRAARKRDLVGRKIIEVDFGRWYDSSRREWITDPILTLDNGTFLRLTTLETDGGVYGTRIDVVKDPMAGC